MFTKVKKAFTATCYSDFVLTQSEKLVNLDMDPRGELVAVIDSKEKSVLMRYLQAIFSQIIPQKREHVNRFSDIRIERIFLANKCKFNPWIGNPLLAVRMVKDLFNVIDIEKGKFVHPSHLKSDGDGYCN